MSYPDITFTLEQYRAQSDEEQQRTLAAYRVALELTDEFKLKVGADDLDG